MFSLTEELSIYIYVILPVSCTANHQQSISIVCHLRMRTSVVCKAAVPSEMFIPRPLTPWLVVTSADREREGAFEALKLSLSTL